MRHLLNTLFVTSEDAYLTLDGENVVVNRDKQEMGRFPLHNLSGIISFSYAGASPALMGACAARDIGLAFCTPRGRFLARTTGFSNGNVLLRRMQYRAADDPVQSCRISKYMIFGKLYNARWSIERTRRDHAPRIDGEKFRAASETIRGLLSQVAEASSPESLRGLEGVGAAAYFKVFDDMILREKASFYFHGRNRRPPLDNVNAMLSFAYGLLANDCASALESVGLDAYVGFLHRDRPGRVSLALDLMEELRPCMADRFVLTMINNRVMTPDDFDESENGAVRMSDDARRKFLKSWQERKQEVITHPYLGEKLPWGLVPYMQALLLARYLREDLDAYPPFYGSKARQMLVLITYDVNTEDAAGRKRLRQIAKQCVNYGQRVQNSVFECVVDAAQAKMLQHKLCAIMDDKRDSLRFYYLGNHYQTKVEHFGAKATYEAEGVLII